MTIENWLPVVGFEGEYEVSDLGRVKSVTRFRPHNRYPGKIMLWQERILRPAKQRSGHLLVALSGKMRRVHRLVAEAFLPPRPFADALVRHLDGDPENNRASNLCWGTQKDNMGDARRHNTIPLGVARPNSKLTPEAVKQIRQVATSQTLSDIARTHNVSPATVRDVIIGRSWVHV